MDNEGYLPKGHQTPGHGETGRYQTDAETYDLKYLYALNAVSRHYLGYKSLNTISIAALASSILGSFILQLLF
jgi:hypothetical protein